MTTTNEELELKKQYLALLEEKANRIKYNKAAYSLFQDHNVNEQGQDISRHLYKAHLKFFKAGAEYTERAFIAANRAGKTVAGSYEMYLHLTGLYPEWWEGKRFNRPIRAWAVGKTNDTTRDVLQYELLGEVTAPGTGTIPQSCIGELIMRRGAARAVQDAYIKHVSGGWSYLGFKSYEMKQDSFMGTAMDVVWHDEECPDKDVYTECLMRTMTGKGIMFTTFTPLRGISEVVKQFLPNGRFPEDGIVRREDGAVTSKFCVNCTWDDAPHLSQEVKTKMLAEMSDYDREARSMGIPVLGEGAIYGIPRSLYVVEPFAIPSYFPRAFAIDFGWGTTAVVWGALDPSTGITYLYSEHYLGKTPVPVHASAMKTRGTYIYGVCDPSGGGQGGPEGLGWMEAFANEDIVMSGVRKRGVEAGIAQVRVGLENGTIKIFSTLTNLLSEMQFYRREKGPNDEVKIVKTHDHACDAMRYLITEGMQYARTADDDRESSGSFHYDDGMSSKITGY
jgi:phage terminase large subunit-like protein